MMMTTKWIPNMVLQKSESSSELESKKNIVYYLFRVKFKTKDSYVLVNVP